MLKEHHLPEVKAVYKALGPFDFTCEEENEFEEQERTMQDKFESRRSGNNYRGQINGNNRPDGKGFKVFPNGSIYEGYFADG